MRMMWTALRGILGSLVAFCTPWSQSPNKLVEGAWEAMTGQEHAGQGWQLRGGMRRHVCAFKQIKKCRYITYCSGGKGGFQQHHAYILQLGL